MHKYMREHSIIGSNFIEFQKDKHKFKSFYTKTIVRTVSQKKKNVCVVLLLTLKS